MQVDPCEISRGYWLYQIHWCTISDVLNLTQFLFQLPQRWPALGSQPPTTSAQPRLGLRSHPGASLLTLQNSISAYLCATWSVRDSKAGEVNIWPVKKKELWIRISSSSSLWVVLEGVCFWALRFLNKNSISQPFLTLSFLLCFVLLVPHFSSLRVKSLIKEELTIFASDSCPRKCKLKYPEKINKFQTGNHKDKCESPEST